MYAIIAGREPSRSWLFQALYPIKKLDIMAHSMYSLKAMDEEDIIFGTHTLAEQKLVVVFSLKGKMAEVDMGFLDGVYVNLMDHSEVTINGGKLQLNSGPVIIGILE
ncbi:hypothetical protein [Paenibacillus crassostreae]|nr:hypothetical protein [Paenibacillus crassostreae]